MHAVEQPGAGRRRLPTLCPAEPDRTPAAGRSIRRAPAGMARRLVAAIAAWRARRRARRRLESWLTIDPRTLADIGLRPADVQAMVYAGAADAQVATRGGRWPTLGDTVVEARRRNPPLRLVAGDDLDAAA